MVSDSGLTGSAQNIRKSFSFGCLQTSYIFMEHRRCQVSADQLSPSLPYCVCVLVPVAMILHATWTCKEGPSFSNYPVNPVEVELLLLSLALPFLTCFLPLCLCLDSFNPNQEIKSDIKRHIINDDLIVG